MYDVSFTVTPIGTTTDGEKRYLVANASTVSGAPRIGLIVNETVKDLLLYFNKLWNKHSTAVLKCLKNHYRTIINMVHAFEEEATAANSPSNFAQTPLVGIPTYEENEVDGVSLSTVKYVNAGEAARLLSAVIDTSYVEAFIAIATDYTNYPALWYFVLNKYKSLFTGHILHVEEE